MTSRSGCWVAVVALLAACGGDKDDDDAGGGAGSDATGGEARGGGDATDGGGEGGVGTTGGSATGGSATGGSTTGGNTTGGNTTGGNTTGGGGGAGAGSDVPNTGGAAGSDGATGGTQKTGGTAGSGDDGGTAGSGGDAGGLAAAGASTGGSTLGGWAGGGSDTGGDDAGGASGTGGAAGSGGVAGGTGGGAVDDAEACTDAGGTIETISCCETVGDFPNRCHGVDCTCSSAHEVLSCRCPEGECFDGSTCVHDCGPYPACNWCGGEPLLDEDGCTVGYACTSGRDACTAAPCEDDLDCTTTGEECTDWGVCWAPNATVTGEYAMVANPCTTDPCLPGLVYAIVSEEQTVILLLRGQWIRYSTDWNVWPGVVPEVGDQVVARGDLSGGELLLTSLEIVE